MLETGEAMDCRGGVGARLLFVPPGVGVLGLLGQSRREIQFESIPTLDRTVW